MADDHYDVPEELDPETLNEEDANDAAAAFEALRDTVETLATDHTREMMTIRRGVEFALDQMERRGAPVDYSAELGAINQNQAATNELLRGIEQSPALRHGPEHYARVLERSGENLVRTAAQQIERQAADLKHAGRNLSAHVAGARNRNRQNRWLLIAACGGLLAGVCLTLFLPAVLPFAVAPRVASVVMRKTPWQAGMALMTFDSPTSWRRVAAADQLIQANKVEVTACVEAATKSSEDQRCTIKVPVPRQ